MKNLVLTGMLVLALVGCGTVAGPVNPPVEQTMFNLGAEVEEEKPQPPDPKVVARELLNRGHREEAASVLEAGLARNPLDVAAIDLLVATRLDLAELNTSVELWPEASSQLERALSFINACRMQSFRRVEPDMSWFDRTRSHKNTLESRIQRYVEAIVRSSSALLDQARSFWGSDKEKVIEALVMLDGVKKLLPHVGLSTRNKYAELWADLYNRLGTANRERYKVRTTLRNGLVD